MNQMNQVVIEGNVVRDTTVRETARGTRVCIVPIATNHFYRNANGETQKEVAFFDVEAWGDNFCTRMAQMAKKGRGLRVVGRLKQDRWKNQEGKSASKIYILAEHIDFQHPKTEEKSDSDSEARTNAKSAAEGIRAESEFSDTSGEFADGGETVF
ncbi:single-stranded DNA-binding protein [Treponema sp. UBA3813]|jgi:single-strand DNA-binding protein|uniref:single-stranded DNA-binding protein n=1 Tax=Treponema sp. UBA3813 TaxID=1947715 RepID=UPI0025D24C4D|nr:single-stranded DNA-binding protein [Treponema sp. UBA3813]